MTEAYWARYESVIDRQIRMAQERGDFDDLPGKGKPLPGLDGPDDENWWLKGYLQREGVPSDALLPTPLQLRKEAERLPDEVRNLTSEQDVRAAAVELNARIAAWLRAPEGPAVPVRPVDVDALVRRWRDERPNPISPAPTPPAPAPPAADPSAPEEPQRRASWWRRLARRGSPEGERRQHLGPTAGE